ncbi:MAG TPA: serine/threonine-protein kinase [Candidatus Acidoferrum sp.]|nr:serine/threonine-protein kinase [Candidatus Acidoferrum sp.]
MDFLSDKALARLRKAETPPDFSATRYTLREFLARGGMGAVYLAQDQVLDRRVAIKILDSADPDGALAERLNKEARVLAQLEHPGIVPVHDAGTLPDGHTYYVMKFVAGAHLDQFLANVPSLPERLRLFLRICDSVSFAHSRGILHRDLKPSNIMIGAFGEVLVMDWGLAKILEPSVTPDSQPAVRSAALSSSSSTLSARSSAATRDGMAMGTPGFMSPEQAAGKSADLDEGSDIFSLGKLLEFIVRPMANQNSARLSRALQAICDKASAADRTQRYGKVAELADDVSRFLDGAPVSAHRENLWERCLRFYRRYQAAILLIAMYLLMRGLFVIYSRR